MTDDKPNEDNEGSQDISFKATGGWIDAEPVGELIYFPHSSSTINVGDSRVADLLYPNLSAGIYFYEYSWAKNSRNDWCEYLIEKYGEENVE